MRNPMRRAGVCAAALAVTATIVAPAAAAARTDPADRPPFGGEEPARMVLASIEIVSDRGIVERQSLPPTGFELLAPEAISIARATDAAASQDGRLRAFPSAFQDRTWEVTFLDADGDAVALVVIDDRTGEVLEEWTGYQVETKLARGYPGAVSGIVNAVWIWIPLCLLFVAPFVDLRRPFRLLHLDLAALLAFSASLYFFNRGEIGVSAPLVYPVLAYLFARLALLGFRPRESDERLLPHLGPRFLMGGIAALVALHVFIAVFEAKVIDVGLASVIGADRVTGGEFLYGTGSATGQPIRVDVYGPVNYLAYVPFEQLLPWSGEWDSVPAARAASVSFGLLTGLCLFVLGGRLRTGSGGRTLGLALAFAWLAYPFTLYGVASSFNDMLVALLVTGSLLVLSSAPARGAIAALAGLTKFGPLALVPLLAAGEGDRRPRSLLAFGAAFLAVAAVATALVIDGTGLRDLYDRSLGYQAGRGSPFSVWGQAPSLEPLQTLTTVLAVGFGAALYFVPGRRSVIQVAALAGAAMIAIQVPATHWFYPYCLWFAPFALVAFLAPLRSS